MAIAMRYGTPGESSGAVGGGSADLPEWTLAGTSTSSSQTVSYPATANEILIKGKSNHSSAPAAFAYMTVASLADVSVILVGGYYYGSSDYGLMNVNHDAANNTLAFRLMRYGNVTGGTFSFYYR